MGRGIEKLHPAVRKKAERFLTLCKEAGLPVLITETWRTREEQDALYARGRDAAGRVVNKAAVVTRAQYPYSMHCWGLAFDFCKNVKGREFDDDDFFRRAGEIARDLGLIWGGDWVAWPDRPHLEDRNAAGTVNELIKRYGTPEAFRDTWGAR